MTNDPREELGLITVGGVEITLAALSKLPLDRRAAIYRGIWLGNSIESAIASLIDPQSDKDSDSAKELVNGLWMALQGHEWPLPITMSIATAFDVATSDSYQGNNRRAQATRAIFNIIANLGYPELAALLQLDTQAVSDTVAAWWGEIKVGGKWGALADLIKKTCDLSVSAKSLRVQYAAWKKRELPASISQKPRPKPRP